jgi:hypothetical protein
MTNPDRLYHLLPTVYQTRDAEQGYPLRALLRIIAGQVDLVEEEMAQLYANWFIETCQDWVVPYIGDLVGYEPVHEAGEPADPTTEQGRRLNKILAPRREVADTIRFRRRKGTLAVLELLARAVAGWPARAVEFYKLAARAQHVNHIRPGCTLVDLRNANALRRIDAPFDEVSHTIEVRRINSGRSRGRYNIPSVGLFVWRLKHYSVTGTPAFCQDARSNRYHFSALGNDAPLYTNPRAEAGPADIAGELNVPAPIHRKAFDLHKKDYYGPGKSLQIWQVTDETGRSAQPVPLDDIIPADLTHWRYRPKNNKVAVDPVLGRMVFSRETPPKYGVRVLYQYGFSADMGGGEYHRPIRQHPAATVYYAGNGRHLGAALEKWHQENPEHAVIEIVDSGVYTMPESIPIKLKAHQSLQLRAANGKRPIIRLLDWQISRPDAFFVEGETGSRFTLDGLLVLGRGMMIRGAFSRINIRHCTLVPGWSIDSDCEPQQIEPSLELVDTPRIRLNIDHSIIGSIQIDLDQVKADPVPVTIQDSIVDATGHDCDDPVCEALGAPDWPLAHARLTIKRSTVLGRVYTHAIELAENTIFMGRIKVGRRQIGCMRFCYAPPGSKTPRRYHCQPDLVEKPIREKFIQDKISPEQKEVDITRKRLRVRPRFDSIRYGQPVYCRLAAACATEIKRGADDTSEMGVFHDLFEPQRMANLKIRIEEYTPAGMDAGIITAS